MRIFPLFRHLIYFRVPRNRLIEMIDLAKCDYYDIIIKTEFERFNIYGKMK